MQQKNWFATQTRSHIFELNVSTSEKFPVLIISCPVLTHFGCCIHTGDVNQNNITSKKNGWSTYFLLQFPELYTYNELQLFLQFSCPKEAIKVKYFSGVKWSRFFDQHRKCENLSEKGTWSNHIITFPCTYPSNWRQILMKSNLNDMTNTGDQCPVRDTNNRQTTTTPPIQRILAESMIGNHKQQVTDDIVPSYIYSGKRKFSDVSSILLPKDEEKEIQEFHPRIIELFQEFSLHYCNKRIFSGADTRNK